MKKQIIVSSAILMGLVFMLTTNAWAERERPRGRENGQHLRERGDQRSDRGVKPDRKRHWRGRDHHRDRPGDRWAPGKRHQVRKRHDRRWHHPKPHAGQRHRWHPPRQHRRNHRWRPGRHHRPHHFRRPAHHRRWHTHHSVGYPAVAEHVYHHDGQAESEPTAAEQFAIVASVNDPAGVSYAFGINGTN